MISVVMVNDYSDFQHNYFSLTEKNWLIEFQVIKWLQKAR